MTLKNCAKCGRMFSATLDQKHCSKCTENDEEEFKVVREYIYDNPGCNIGEVAEATEVDEDKILKFLKQGKLELKGEGVGYGCDKCGINITSGKYCEKCTYELSHGLKEAFGLNKKEAPVEKKKPSGSDAKKMHISTKK